MGSVYEQEGTFQESTFLENAFRVKRIFWNDSKRLYILQGGNTYEIRFNYINSGWNDL